MGACRRPDGKSLFFLEHPLDDNGEITKIYTRYANSLSTDGLHRKHWQILLIELSFRQMLILFFFSRPKNEEVRNVSSRRSSRDD